MVHGQIRVLSRGKLRTQGLPDPVGGEEWMFSGDEMTPPVKSVKQALSQTPPFDPDNDILHPIGTDHPITSTNLLDGFQTAIGHADHRSRDEAGG